jgi:hypothetical protein
MITMLDDDYLAKKFRICNPLDLDDDYLSYGIQ